MSDRGLSDFIREENNEKAVTHVWSVRFDQWNRVLSEN
jgi:hypothetical protein